MDTDNDGIPDEIEGTGDADGDDAPNYLDDDAEFRLSVIHGNTSAG